MPPPAISVLVSTRNRQRLLSGGLESLWSQSFQDFEVIIADDASSDGTEEYLREVERSDPRVRYVRLPEQGGAQRARNAALELARGEFVTGLDDDDEFTADRLKNFILSWRELEPSGQCFSCLFTGQLCNDGSQTTVFQRGAELVTARDLLVRNTIGNNVFTRTEYLRGVGGYDEALPAWQDMETFYRLLTTFGPARRIEPPSYIYRVDERPDRTSAKEPKVREAFDLLSAKHRLSPRQKSAIYSQMFTNFYGFKPNARDWGRAIAWGLSPRLLALLAKATATTLLRR
jgi:glycosyltransferase involved in cell wall biosynthesis